MQFSGKTEIQVKEGLATLGKDPMLQLNEYADKTCVYARTSESEVVKLAEYLKGVGEKISEAQGTDKLKN